MGQPCDTIRLYSAQADAVLQVLERDGVSFSKAEYVRGKYGESAPIFLTAYSWFVSRMEKIVPRPQGAEFPYWAFGALTAWIGRAREKRWPWMCPLTRRCFLTCTTETRSCSFDTLERTSRRSGCFKGSLPAAACGRPT